MRLLPALGPSHAAASHLRHERVCTWKHHLVLCLTCRRFDGADYEEVPLLNVGEAAGLDIFDAFLLQQQSREQRGAAQEAQQSGEASAQAAQQQEPQHPGLPAAEQQEPARQKKPKKKPLSRAEKARIEREKNREIQVRATALGPGGRVG